MNVTTKYTANKDGAGRIVATGAGRQRTVPYVHNDTPENNHKHAASTLVATFVRPDRRGFLMATAKQEDLGNGKRRFSVAL